MYTPCIHSLHRITNKQKLLQQLSNFKGEQNTISNIKTIYLSMYNKNITKNN